MIAKFARLEFELFTKPSKFGLFTGSSALRSAHIKKTFGAALTGSDPKAAKRENLFLIIEGLISIVNR